MKGFIIMPIMNTALRLILVPCGVV